MHKPYGVCRAGIPSHDIQTMQGQGHRRGHHAESRQAQTRTTAAVNRSADGSPLAQPACPAHVLAWMHLRGHMRGALAIICPGVWGIWGNTMEITNINVYLGSPPQGIGPPERKPHSETDYPRPCWQTTAKWPHSEMAATAK